MLTVIGSFARALNQKGRTQNTGHRIQNTGDRGPLGSEPRAFLPRNVDAERFACFPPLPGYTYALRDVQPAEMYLKK